MELIVRHNLLRYAATVVIGLAMCDIATAQTPTPAAPISVTDPSLNDPMAQALEPVRQAIARQDYTAAQTALDAAKRQNPNHPGIALYESMIQRRQGQGQTIDTQSPLRTPRAGVTPMPAPEMTPEPETPTEEAAPPAPAPATPVEAPAPTPAADDSLMGKAKSLWENEMVRYAVYGLAGLIVLFILISMLKKRRNRTDELEEPKHATPMSTGVMTMGGLDDHLGEEESQGSFGSFNPSVGGTSMAGGLSASPTSMDFTPSDSGSTGTTSESPSFGSSAPGSSLGGSALSGGGGMAGYSMPSFGHDDEEEEAPAPPPRPVAPSNPVDDDAPVSFESMQPDEPEEAPAPPPAAAPAPKAVSDEGLDALGINFGGVGEPGAEKPATPKPFDEEETMILSGPEDAPVPPAASPKAPVNPTPTSTPSIAPGTVDLEDIFGSQPLPGTFNDAETIREQSQPLSAGSFSDAETLRDPSQTPGPDKLSTAPEDEDINSQTLPTFVSYPGADNPEDSAETPPPPRQRATAATNAESDSISFEELFGSSSESSLEVPAEPEPTPAPEPEPEPELPPAKPMGEMSIEDALAATLGDMQEQAPDATSAPEPTVDEVIGSSTESLDERTERMFSEQMNKARAAVAEKNWRQAVHFLSIASALHPEHEEAKQMLKDARAEKRKSEESV